MNSSYESNVDVQGKSTVTNLFSAPLFLRNCKSNLILTLAVLLIMCLMCGVITVASNIIATEKVSDNVQDAQEDLFAYLGGMATYNQSMGALTNTTLSCQDFLNGNDRSAYADAFAFINENADLDLELSTSGFENVLATLEESPVSLETYVEEFEFAYALAQSEGVFTGNELSIDDMMKTTLEVAGVSSDLVDNMAEMDTTSLLNTMYFKVIGLLPIFLLIVVLGYSLIAGSVDGGSMGYILSTPTKRTAVATTQAAFMIIVPAILIAIVCAEKIAVTNVLTGEANAKMLMTMYAGWYLLVEAVAALCFFGSCLFNTSGRALAFGGGLAVWFFIASFLGVFGGENLVNMGIGVEQLSVFNKLTLTGLLDIDAISTIGSASVDTSYVTGFIILGAIAMAFYLAGIIRFKTKDLPL